MNTHHSDATQPGAMPPADPGALGLDPVRLARIGERLRDDVAQGRLPGAAWMVARHGRLAWVDALGRLGPDADAPPMTRDAVFRIYSMTKPVVSLVVMQLVEEGRLLLADAVSRWLPEFAGLQVAEERGAEVVFTPAAREPTVHDLLRHTAGLTYEFLGERHVHRRYTQAEIASRQRSNAEFCRVLAALPLAHQPGRVWDYSRATDVLGRLVEVITGQTLGAALHERVFAPLGMRETGFVVPVALHHRIAEPFALDPDSGEPVHLINPRVAAPMEMGGGGLMSTLDDYTRFLWMLARGGELGGVRLVSRTTIELMTADHLGTIPRAGDLLPDGHGFGLGFAVRTAPGLAPLPGSVGLYYWSGIAGTSFFVDPREELFAMLLTQAPGQRARLRQTFRQMVCAAIAD